MRRRELMLLLGSAMTAARAPRAQQKAMPVIGYLSSTSPGPYLAMYRQALARLTSSQHSAASTPLGRQKKQLR